MSETSPPQTAVQPADAAPAVVCDLDGTLITSDTMWESVLQLLRSQPWMLVLLPIWASKGRVHFKHEVARRSPIDAGALPYRDSVLEYLRQADAEGRQLILATGSVRTAADAVADHVGLFDQVISTTETTNTTGEAKLHALRELLGDQPFEYLGNAGSDMAVWEAAARVIPVGPDRQIHRRADETFGERVYRLQDAPTARRTLGLLKSMRPQQWLKNLLMVVPLLASHELGDGGKWLGLGLALLAMCAAASAVYLVNDLLDLPADRMHPRKRDRPLASGWVPVTAALGALPVLAVVAVVAAWLSGPAVLGWVAVYTAAAMTYSAGIKGRAVLDVLWLAGLYTLRVVIGAAAADVFLSTWLAEVAMFGFLSLAFAKRYAELTMVQGRGGTEAAGRGYTTHDLPLIAMGGLVSGYAAVVVLGLYVNGEMVTVLYTRPQLLWLICPLMLYWFTRLWFKAHRRRLVDDPLLFALRDGPSWVVVLGTLALGVAAAGL